MAYIFRPTYARTDPRTGKKVRRKLKKWHIRYRCPDGRVLRVAGYTDKEATKQLAARLEKKAARQQEGMVDPFEEHRRRPVTEHLADFRRYLEAKGNTTKHARQTCTRAQTLASGCRFVRLSDLSASVMVEWLAGERTASHMGIQTSNYYLRDFKSFLAWLIKDRRMGENPMAHLSPMNANVEERLERRALQPKEFAAFVEAAGKGKAFRGLTGSDRVVVYTLAAYTGFREGELGSLTPASFNLNADSPTVTAQAAYSKRRRKDVQPLRPDVAEMMRLYIADKPQDQRLWPGSWANKGAEMVRRDLAAAGIPFKDGAGRVFDFHAIRHQFISSLAAAGVHPKVAQNLARHSTITLTMDRYTHLGLLDQTAALDKLPVLPIPGRRSEPMAATGTDDAHSPQHSPAPEIPCIRLRPAETPKGGLANRLGRQKTPEMTPLAGDCDRMRTDERVEAPPGFEPGMADLQSAALPLG